MLKQKFKKFGPTLKKLLQIKIAALINLKVLKAKKKKWVNYVRLLKSNLSKNKYKKYKIFDQTKTLLQKRNRFELNYSKMYKKNFTFYKIFNIFFGKLKKNYYNKITNKFVNTKLNVNNSKTLLLKILESRLDYVLLRAKFYSTLKSAKNAILHGCVYVNKKVVKKNSFLLKSGDIIILSDKAKKKLKNNLVNSLKWPILPNYLLVNYKTTEILFLGTFFNENYFIFFYPFFFNLPEKIL